MSLQMDPNPEVAQVAELEVDMFFSPKRRHPSTGLGRHTFVLPINADERAPEPVDLDESNEFFHQPKTFFWSCSFIFTVAKNIDNIEDSDGLFGDEAVVSTSDNEFDEASPWNIFDL